jgi:uncharacterized protein YkwD
MRYSSLLGLFLFIFVGCGTKNVYYKQSTVVSHPYPAPKLNTSMKKSYLTAVNSMRSKGRNCGNMGYFASAPALRWNDALYHAAYEHSADMLATRKFTHGGSGGSSDWTAKVQHLGRASNFKDRMENNGYTEWRKLAQNIASGMSSLEDTMQQWRESEHHCANIMNPIFTTFGMAHTADKGTKFIHYWTQNFAVHQ